MSLYRDMILCVAIGGLRHSMPRRCDTARQSAHAHDDMVGHACDKAGGGPQHDALCATTRRPTLSVPVTWA